MMFKKWENKNRTKKLESSNRGVIAIVEDEENELIVREDYNSPKKIRYPK